RTGRVLTARVDHHRGHAVVECRGECRWGHSPGVYGNRAQGKAARAQQIEEPGEARVFDRDQVARSELRSQSALDPVERAADYRQLLGCDPHLLELRTGQVEKPRVGRVAAVELTRWFDVAQDPSQIGQQLRIWV